MTASAHIVGLGLIGGSLARDLMAAGWQVAGFDSNRASAQAALAAGMISRVLDDPADAEACDVIILATPVRDIPGILQRLGVASVRAHVIMDTGSTKRAINDAAVVAGLTTFVGAHPLAGDHLAGWEASRDGLFDEATVFLCPTTLSTDDAITRATSFWQGLRSRTTRLDAVAHDERLALISHLPQVMSSALGAMLANQGYTRADLGPGGRDMTRLAASNAHMWSDILVTNRDAAASAIAAVMQRLAVLTDALERGDANAVVEFMAAGTALS